MSGSRVTDVIRLTIVWDINKSTRSENGEEAGVIEAGGVRGTVLDLEAEAESISTYVCQVNRRVIHLCAGKRWARTRGIGNGEGVLGEGVQDSTGIVEEFEGLVTGVGDGRGDLQVLQPIDIGVWGRGLEGQAGGSGDDDRRGDESDERSTKGGGEHCRDRSERG